jgi:hypothetical protein
VWRWLLSVSARTRDELLLADRDVGMVSRLFSAAVCVERARLARRRSLREPPATEYRELHLVVAAPLHRAATVGRRLRRHAAPAPRVDAR